MKQLLSLLLYCLLLNTATLHAQQKDTTGLTEEMQRLNRLGDSLHKVQLAKDSAFRVMLDESLDKAKEDIDAAKQKEVAKATEQVMNQHEKEQQTKRRTMLWALAGFLFAVAIVRVIAKSRKNRK